jgi:hypothetical protein
LASSAPSKHDLDPGETSCLAIPAAIRSRSLAVKTGMRRKLMTWSKVAV